MLSACSGGVYDFGTRPHTSLCEMAKAGIQKECGGCTWIAHICLSQSRASTPGELPSLTRHLSSLSCSCLPLLLSLLPSSLPSHILFLLFSLLLISFAFSDGCYTYNIQALRHFKGQDIKILLLHPWPLSDPLWG